MNVQTQRWIEAAARLAKRLHEGQKDKAGIDYFEGHLSFVAQLGNDWREIIAGYLHDASEDTPHTAEEVIELLEQEANATLPATIKQELATALNLLNHHSSPLREEYIRKIGQSPLATAVKINDLTHNMDLRRIEFPTEKDYQRLERYKTEFAFLSQKQKERIP